MASRCGSCRRSLTPLRLRLGFHAQRAVSIRPRCSPKRLKEPFKRWADAYQTPIFTINYGFLVNTRLVRPEDEPRRWTDVLDPKWQGKILADDPRAGGGGAVMFRMTWDKFGREFHEKLAAQKPVFGRDYALMARRVAQGEFALYLPYILSDYSNVRGLPVKYIVPEDGVTYGSYAAPILKQCAASECGAAAG